MKWVFRAGLVLSLAVVIGLLTLLPHVLGNSVLTIIEIEQIEDVISKYSVS
jgi:hypothetical protein